ncbi:hypothetical protein ACO1O0_009363 [Amphichorda felina]
MPPRIPTAADFAPLSSTLPHALHFPSPPESTTAILILLHGLGDSHAPFASFARAVNLPGVLAVSIRGTSRLPLDPRGDDGGEGENGGFHWGDDVVVDQGTGGLDADPGFDRAEGLIMEKLVGEVLLGKCGWEMSDIMFFGFGQGGSLALGLASRLRASPRVVDVTDPSTSGGGESKAAKGAFKGVVSVGGPLPASMVPTVSARQKSRTEVLLVQLDAESVDAVRREFEHVRVVNWKRREVAMPRDREEMFPIMKFFADRLNSGWQ